MVTVVEPVPKVLTNLALRQLWQQLNANLSMQSENLGQQADYLELSAGQCADAFKHEEHKLAVAAISDFRDDDATCAAEALQQRLLYQQVVVVLRKIGEGLELINDDYPMIASRTFDRIRSHPVLAKFYKSRI